MKKTVSFRSFAKINIGLKVSSKREDGYHDIETYFQTVDLSDSVRLSFPEEGISVSSTDPQVPSDNRNLAYKAAELFFSESGIKSGCSLHIEKNIPCGAGLGGGSSNAGAVLLALNRVYGNPVDENKLARIALSIGADVPFFLAGGLALGRGAGEILAPAEDVDMKHILIVCPFIHCSTKEVYESYDLLLTEKVNNIRIPRFCCCPDTGYDLYSSLTNDLEAGAFALYEELKSIKSVLEKTGAVFSMMSGSGSSLYAVYNKGSELFSARNRVEGLFSVRAFACRTVGKREYMGNFTF